MSHLNLYLVQDDDRPLYVLAQDWNDALRGWQLRIRRENDMEADEDCQPTGIQLVARHDEIVLPSILPAGTPDDDGCPVDDPGCDGRDGDRHDTCERACGCDAAAKLAEARAAAAEVDRAGGNVAHEPYMGLAAWIRARELMRVIEASNLRPALVSDLVVGAKVWFKPAEALRLYRGAVSMGANEDADGCLYVILDDVDPAICADHSYQSTHFIVARLGELFVPRQEVRQ